MIKQLLRALTLALFLSPSAYALEQKLAINFRSLLYSVELLDEDPRENPENPPIPLPGQIGLPNIYSINFYNGISMYDPSSPDPLLYWSPKFGLEEEAHDLPFVPNQSAMYAPESMLFSNLPMVTGVLLDDLTPGIPLPNVGPGATFHALPNGSEFVSFSAPVTTISIAGANGSFAVEGFTEAGDPPRARPGEFIVDPASGFGDTRQAYVVEDIGGVVSERLLPGIPNHVPDGGSTLILFATGLLGLMATATLSRSGRPQPCPVRAKR